MFSSLSQLSFTRLGCLPAPSDSFACDPPQYQKLKFESTQLVTVVCSWLIFNKFT